MGFLLVILNCWVLGLQSVNSQFPVDLSLVSIPSNSKLVTAVAVQQVLGYIALLEPIHQDSQKNKFFLKSGFRFLTVVLSSVSPFCQTVKFWESVRIICYIPEQLSIVIGFRFLAVVLSSVSLSSKMVQF